jgi:hypothetical protein
MGYGQIVIIAILVPPTTMVLSVFWHIGKVLAIRFLFRKDGENGEERQD